MHNPRVLNVQFAKYLPFKRDEMNTRVHTLPRHMQAELLDALQMSRIVNLVGPRQVGKTTLVRDLYGGGEFLTLDNEVILSAIEADAAGLLASKRKSLGDAPLVIDEAQRSRSLALAIKRIVDEDRRRGQFLLTGSSNVFTAANVSDSLQDVSSHSNFGL